MAIARLLARHRADGDRTGRLAVTVVRPHDPRGRRPATPGTPRRRRRQPRRLRVPTCRPVPLQRQVVGLSGPPRGTSAAGRSRAAASGTPSGVREGLLEQQVSLGWGVVALGLVAGVGGWCAARRGSAPSLASVPVLAPSRSPRSSARSSPERTIGQFTSSGPPRCCTRCSRCSGRTHDSAWSCS